VSLQIFFLDIMVNYFLDNKRSLMLSVKIRDLISQHRYF